jgi:hypothetical protein
MDFLIIINLFGFNPFAESVAAAATTPDSYP